MKFLEICNGDFIININRIIYIEHVLLDEEKKLGE